MAQEKQPDPIDLVLYYADLGRPYIQLIARTCATAREVMPYARLVLLTPTPRSKFLPHFDKIVDLSPDMETTDKTVCYDKVRAMVSWQSLSKRNTLFIDPDLEFKRPFTFGNWDVGLMWRKKKPDQPINTGMVAAKPGAKEFWRKYGSIVANLPEGLRAWWCDQLGFSCLLGSQHHAGKTFGYYDAIVHLFDMHEICTSPELETENTVAFHYKGQTKNNVLNFPEKYGAVSS